MGACPLHIAVGQEAIIINGEDLLLGDFFDQAPSFQHFGEMLGEFFVGVRRGAAEMVPGQAIALAESFLDLVLLITIGAHILTRRGGGQLGGGAMLVRGANRQYFMAAQTLKARINVGGQHRSGQIAEMLDAVDVRQSAGDEDAGHGKPDCVLCAHT
jgi:hypothetical protein